MGPLTRAAVEQNPQDLPLFREAAHVSISAEMWSRIKDIAITLPDKSPWEGRLPYPETVIEIENFASLFVSIVKGVVVISLARHADSEINSYRGPIIKFAPRSDEVWLIDEFNAHVDSIEGAPEQAGEVLATIFAITLDLLFSFMAEPRFVEQTPVSRIRRGMAAKKIGVPALRHTWVKVGWTIGGTTRAKGNLPGSAPQKAFHMVRAHWRKYDRQTPKAERRAHRHGWWVWIEAFYSGNPALGEIKHQYHPKLEDPGKSSKLVHKVVAARIAQTLNPQLADA